MKGNKNILKDATNYAIKSYEFSHGVKLSSIKKETDKKEDINK